MNTVKLLIHLIENHQALVYVIIFLGLIIEGEFILLSLGILLHLGALNPYLSILFIVLGLFVKTVLGYYLGTVIHSKWNHTKFLKHIEKRVFKVVPHFQKKPFWSIFISKFILGANNLVIIFSGYQKVLFKQYIKAESFSTILWAPVLISLGYLFSYTAIHISHEIWRFSFILLLLVVSFIIVDKLISYSYELFEEFYENAQ